MEGCMAAAAIRSSRKSMALLVVKWAGCSLVALLVVGLLGYWIWSAGAEQRAIRDMPDATRRAFYARTLANLQTVCARGAAERIEDFCEREATRILLFPECDQDCQRIAEEQAPRPAR
jgi:hypothetical protein